MPKSSPAKLLVITRGGGGSAWIRRWWVPKPFGVTIRRCVFLGLGWEVERALLHCNLAVSFGPKASVVPVSSKRRRLEGPSKENAKWKEQHCLFVQSCGLDDFHGEQYVGAFEGITTERAKVLKIAFKHLQRCRGMSADVAAEYVVDVSQSIQRASWGRSIRTITTSSTIFSFKHQRLLKPHQHLSIMGMPPTHVSLLGLTETNVRNLAGEAFADPCAAVGIVSLMLACTWCLLDKFHMTVVKSMHNDSYSKLLYRFVAAIPVTPE